MSRFFFVFLYKNNTLKSIFFTTASFSSKNSIFYVKRQVFFLSSAIYLLKHRGFGKVAKKTKSFDRCHTLRSSNFPILPSFFLIYSLRRAPCAFFHVLEPVRKVKAVMVLSFWSAAKNPVLSLYSEILHFAQDDIFRLFVHALTKKRGHGLLTLRDPFVVFMWSASVVSGAGR